jgi:hypothetical protein
MFTLISNGELLCVDSFDKVKEMARGESQAGHKVSIHRATKTEQILAAQRNRGWAVEVRMAGVRDRLACLDNEDAVATLSAVRKNGVSARIVRV